MAVDHTFAGNPLDRADVRRRDPAWLAAAAHSAEARFLPLWQLNVLVDAGLGPATLGWLDTTTIERLGVDQPPIFLGLDHKDRPCFTLDISEVADPHHELALPEGLAFQESRGAAMSLPQADTGILAQARAQVGWHRSHRFCSACGAQTVMQKGGHQRHCDACGTDHFPRTDPVAIMLVSRGDHCLLGQSHGPLVRIGMFSALAGFIDQGETIEEAVRREIREEAGISVGRVTYHSSQPWPFPSSLMIGCHGEALSETITIDAEEMHDVRWVSRDEVLEALAERNPQLKVPGPMAIAHHLIKAWAEGEAGHFS